MKIGYANFDFDAFCTWKSNYTPIEPKSATASWVGDHWSDYFYARQNIFDNCLNIMDRHFFAAAQIDDLKALITHLSDIGEQLQLFYYDDTACIIGYENIQYLMNSDFVTPHYLTDYTALTSSDMKALAGSVSDANLLPALLSETSIKSLNDQKAAEQQKLENVKAEIKAKEEEIRQIMYDKIEKMKAEMQVKLDELNAKLEQCQKEIFIMESQIFSIRCYTGEVIQFHRIRTGKAAPKEEPLIVYQKIRFLDEELGKYISIFDFEGEDDTRLIPLLKSRDDLVDLFVHGNKCLTILRTSRTGKIVAAHEKIDNMLDEYEMYHGKQLALLLRDGENLYIAWCDADNIVINEENAFYSMTKQTTSVSEEDESNSINQKTDIHEALSRYYLLAILQGMIDAKNILDFPERVNVLNPSQKYVVFSLADGWISKNKYGTFSEMLEKAGKNPLKKGDDILTVLYLTPDRNDAYKKYHNDRGIGYKNRTSGVSLQEKTIYSVNLILNDVTVEYEFDAIEIMESIGTCDVMVSKDGVTNKEERPCLVHTIGDKILFSGKEKMTFGFEEYRDIKTYHRDLLECIERRVGAPADHRDTPSLYYKDRDGYEHQYFVHFFGDEAVTLTGEQLYCKKIKSYKITKEVPHMFVSVKQRGYGSYSNGFRDTTYHVNLEVYDREYFPLPFFCSSWIKEVIQTGNIGDIRLPGASASFATMLPYLHKILEYTEDRELAERIALADAGGKDFIETHDDWDAILCEWKIQNNIHTLSKTRAKRFLASYCNS